MMSATQLRATLRPLVRLRAAVQSELRAHCSTTADYPSDGSMNTSSAGLDRRRARLLYQALHRGTKEMDLVLGRFASSQLSKLSEQELNEFESLVNMQDHGGHEYSEWDVYYWITGSSPVPPEFDTPLFRRIKQHAWDTNTKLRKAGKSPTLLT